MEKISIFGRFLKIFVLYYICQKDICYIHDMINLYYELFVFFKTATLYPGVIFGTCFILNFFLWGQHSTGAVSTNELYLLLPHGEMIFNIPIERVIT